MTELTTGFNKPLGDPAAFPPANPDAEILRVLHSTAFDTIAFAHLFPPKYDETTLTFFGGLPIAPADFEWPRSASNDAPLSFLGQVDCASLPGSKLRHFLPHQGILYFFADWDLFEGVDEAKETTGHVQFASGPAASFGTASPPADLPPMYGDNADSYYPWLKHTDRTVRDYPKTSSRIAMRMETLVTYAEEHPTEANGNSAGRYKALWQDAQIAALQKVYGPPVGRGTMFEFPNKRMSYNSEWRPFPAFPHAWLAVEMVCGELLRRLAEAKPRLARGVSVTGAKWPRDPIAHQAIYDQVADDARSWIATARVQGLMTGPSEDDKKAFLAWLDGMNASVEPDNSSDDVRSYYTLNKCIAAAASRACDECVMFSAASAALVPPDVLHELRANHSPLVDSRGSSAGRHQMLGRGRNVQGAPERMEGEHILLMQLDTDEGLRWMMGDCGVLQYWISLEDLRGKRFDRVQVTLEGF